MEKCFVFVWSGTISVLFYMLIEQLAVDYLNAVGYVAPEPIEEEFDPMFTNSPLSLDPANPNNFGHGIAYHEDGYDYLD
jgi:hypothetical protein